MKKKTYTIPFLVFFNIEAPTLGEAVVLGFTRANRIGAKTKLQTQSLLRVNSDNMTEFDKQYTNWINGKPVTLPKDARNYHKNR